MGSLHEGGRIDKERPRGRRLLGALAVIAMMSALLVAGAHPSAAATTKSFNASCAGADAATKNALSSFGGALSAPVTVVTNAPPFVEPGQTGVGISVSLSLALDTKTVNTVAAISPSLTVSNVKAPIVVAGPTSTKSINANLPAQTLTLTAGKPFNATFPAISGQLNDIGNSGLIKIVSQGLTFTIKLNSGPLTTPLNLSCTTGATLASIPIKVAGSPDIKQPIEIQTTEGSSETIDVLAEHVTNGRTKDGVEQQVDPSTLKILEGDAQIVDGKVVANAPAAGTQADVTFEVCAGTIKIAEADPGTSEVQELRLFLDVNRQALKRQMGARFGFDGEAAAKVVWSMDFDGLFFKEPIPPADESKPEDAGDGWVSWWQLTVNNYILNAHTYPTAAEMQAGLESIPTIGPGNVKVTQGDIVANGLGNVPEGVTLPYGIEYMPYMVEFQGDLANKAVDQITTERLYSFLPQEIKESLLALAGNLGGGDDDGGGEGPEPTPIPDGLTAKEYVDQLSARAGQLWAEGKILDGLDGSPGWITTVQLMFKVVGENIADLIDVDAVTALLNEIFQPTPETATLVQGEDPTPEEFQELCSQGIITLVSAEVAGAAETAGTGAPGAAVEGATLVPAG